MKEQKSAIVLSNEFIAKGIYSMWLELDCSMDVKAGQFVTIYLNDNSRLLPRPFGICQVKKNRMRIVYKVAGEGTREMSLYGNGDCVDYIAPLGNGFEKRKDKKAVVIGGGVGLPPLVKLVEELSGAVPVSVVAGYRDEIFLKDELSRADNLYIATEDGSFGIKGTVIDAVKSYGVCGDVIYACGPMPMLKAVKDYAIENDIECQISLEERMACGIGACLACVCKSAKKDDHTNVKNKRICKDGPVFMAGEVLL